MQIRQVASPNFGPRKNGLKAQFVVLHYTAMCSAEAAIERLCDPDAEVSAHYVVAASGEITQLVAEDMRAWHAGAGSWGGLEDINSRSIGIELDNTGVAPFSSGLMNSLEILLTGILDRNSIKPQNVIAHSDIAPTRKCDPGHKFDWQRLAREGLSIWPSQLGNADIDEAIFQRNANAFGYDVSDLASTISAFRQRFNPSAIGDLKSQDFAMMAALAREFPASGLDQNLSKV